MTRKCWAVVTFGLGVALAPLVHQLGSACLYPAAAVAQEQLEPHVLLPAVESKSPPQNTDGTPRRAANGKVDEFSPSLEPDGFNKRNGPTPTKISYPTPIEESPVDQGRMTETTVPARETVPMRSSIKTPSVVRVSQWVARTSLPSNPQPINKAAAMALAGNVP